MVEKYSHYADLVSAIQKQNALHALTPMDPINGAFLLLDDRRMLNFCSYDHLGLSDHHEIKKNGIKYLLEHGVSQALAVDDLYLSCQYKVEKKLSKLLKRESSLFFFSRSEANRTALAALGHQNATIFIDEECHHSLFEGAMDSEANVHLFPHRKLDRLEHLLEDAKTKTKIIVSESVFSMTGDVANLSTLVELADHFDALLFIDDSHAFGILGADGMGLAAQLEEVDLITGSFSKSSGACGGYLACSEMLKSYIINFSFTPIASPISPPIIGAIEQALDLIPQMEGERKQLQQRSHWLRELLRETGFDIPRNNTPLLSLPFENESEGASLSGFLKKEQILVRYLSLDEGERARVNIALNVSHMPDHLTRLVDCIKTWQVQHRVSHACAH